MGLPELYIYSDESGSLSELPFVLSAVCSMYGPVSFELNTPLKEKLREISFKYICVYDEDTFKKICSKTARMPNETDHNYVHRIYQSRAVTQCLKDALLFPYTGTDIKKRFSKVNIVLHSKTYENRLHEKYGEFLRNEVYNAIRNAIQDDLDGIKSYTNKECVESLTVRGRLMLKVVEEYRNNTSVSPTSNEGSDEMLLAHKLVNGWRRNIKKEISNNYFEEVGVKVLDFNVNIIE